MSSIYSKNNKELSEVKVVTADKVWEKKNNQFKLRKEMKKCLKTRS